MKGDKTFSGITPDYGTVLRINERVTSESTAALMEQVAIYESAYLGGHLRPVRRAVFIDRPMFGLSVMANNIPLLDIALRSARQAFKPYDYLQEFDTVLEQMGGSSRAPAITVIPCTTLLANGYKFADSLIQAQNAWYQDHATWCVGGAANPKNRVSPVTQIAVNGQPAQPALPINAPYVPIKNVAFDGTATMPTKEAQPYANDGIVLLPVLGQGPAPFLVAERDLDYGTLRSSLPLSPASKGLNQLSNLVPLRWAIFYQEQDAEVESPVRKLAMIAFLNHLFDYLDAVNLEPGQYQWPDATGSPAAPYQKDRHGDTGHDLINTLLSEVVRSASLRLEYMTAEELPASNELQLIRAIANLLYLLDNREVLIQALCNTASIRQFVTILLESQLVHAGADVYAVRDTVAGRQEIGTDFQAGIAPPESCQFLWERVMTMLPADVFETVTAQAIGPVGAGGILGPAPSTYDRLVTQLTALCARPDGTLDMALRATAIGRMLIKNLGNDMRADYVAAALLNRMRESVPVIIKLLKGEIPGFEHLHVPVANAALGAEVTLNILESINLMLDRDLLATKNVLEWEAPYSGAHFNTAWQAYSVKFPIYPIEYVIHNLALDYLGELNLVSKKLPSRYDEKGANWGTRQVKTPTVVENAFRTCGLTMVQCEPAMTYVPLHREKVPLYRTFMKGEMRSVGRKNPYCPDNELCGDVSTAHAALKVTSTYYVRSATIWNQMMEMPRQVVARSYNPQPVPKYWHDFICMDITGQQLASVVRTASTRLADALLAPDTGPHAHGYTHLIDVNPAFRDVAIVLPYVMAMIQTPPEAYDFTMYSRVVFESDQKICNIAGTPVVPEQFTPEVGVEEWALPNLMNQMAYHASPVTHMILPLTWNAVR